MGLLPKSMVFLGSILLIHACYSAHEHSSLRQTSSSDSFKAPTTLNSNTAFASLSTGPITTLPLDIAIETVIAVAVLCVAIVLSADPLKPISWRVWGEGIERGKGKEGEGYSMLDNDKRKGFMDIRRERKEFESWAKGSKALAS